MALWYGASDRRLFHVTRHDACCCPRLYCDCTPQTKQLVVHHIWPVTQALFGSRTARDIFANRFRYFVLYHDTIDAVLHENLFELTRIYSWYSGRFSLPGDKQHLMSFGEYMDLVAHGKLAHDSYVMDGAQSLRLPSAAGTFLNRDLDPVLESSSVHTPHRQLV